MSSDSRKSRQLSFEGENSAKAAEVQAPIVDNSIKKEDLKKLFREEIDILIAEQLAISKKAMIAELEKKNDDLLSDKLKRLELKEKEYVTARDSIKALISNIEESYKDMVANEIGGLDTIIVPIVMEVLYKIWGDAKFYKKTIVKIVGECLEGYKGDYTIKIRVSEGDYRLLKEQFDDQVSIKCLVADKRLDDGQCVFDDGISLYETGLLNQLDNLRMLFVARLRENHGS